jgi:hypothetical protein
MYGKPPGERTGGFWFGELQSEEASAEIHASAAGKKSSLLRSEWHVRQPRPLIEILVG